jgi:hypothetical protein
MPNLGFLYAWVRNSLDFKLPVVKVYKKLRTSSSYSNFFSQILFTAQKSWEILENIIFLV